MKLLAELALRFAGQPIVAMSGGPSLPQHVNRCPADAVYLSANQHGALLRKADFIVCIDDIAPKLRPFGVPIIGPRHWCDYRIHDRRLVGNSGMMAIWVAWVLGGHPILVAGMDCYQGKLYWHDARLRSSSLGRPQRFFDDRLTELSRLLTGATIRSCGGPTTRFFPAWDPAESLPSYAPPADLVGMRELVPWRIRITAGGVRLGHVRMPMGTVLDASPAEGARLLRRGDAEAVSLPLGVTVQRRPRRRHRRRLRRARW